MPARILIVLLAVTACTSGATTGARSPAPRPSPVVTAPPSAPASPSASPATPASAGSVVLAVTDGKGGLGLYAVPPGKHSAAFVRRLAGPPDSAIMATSLSAGAAPARGAGGRGVRGGATGAPR